MITATYFRVGQATANESSPASVYTASGCLRNFSGADLEAFIVFPAPVLPAESLLKLSSAYIKIRPKVNVTFSVPATIKVELLPRSIEKTGLVRTSVISWNNRPAVHGAAGSVTTTLPVASLSHWTTYNLDVTALVQYLLDNGIKANYGGYKLSLIYPVNEMNKLVIDPYYLDMKILYSIPPDKPFNLSPANNVAVDDLKPVLTASVTDSYPATDKVSKVQVQILNADTGATVEDSGVVASSSATYTPASNLTPNTNYKWRIKAADAAGDFSVWSDYSYFSHRTNGTLAITEPAVSEQLYTYTDDADFQGASVSLSNCEVSGNSIILASGKTSGYATFDISSPTWIKAIYGIGTTGEEGTTKTIRWDILTSSNELVLGNQTSAQLAAINYLARWVVKYKHLKFKAKFTANGDGLALDSFNVRALGYVTSNSPFINHTFTAGSNGAQVKRWIEVTKWDDKLKAYSVTPLIAGYWETTTSVSAQLNGLLLDEVNAQASNVYKVKVAILDGSGGLERNPADYVLSELYLERIPKAGATSPTYTVTPTTGGVTTGGGQTITGGTGGIEGATALAIYSWNPLANNGAGGYQLAVLSDISDLLSEDGSTWTYEDILAPSGTVSYRVEAVYDNDHSAPTTVQSAAVSDGVFLVALDAYQVTPVVVPIYNASIGLSTPESAVMHDVVSRIDPVKITDGIRADKVSVAGVLDSDDSHTADEYKCRLDWMYRNTVNVQVWLKFRGRTMQIDFEPGSLSVDMDNSFNAEVAFEARELRSGSARDYVTL